jgi:hypothetical protein
MSKRIATNITTQEPAPVSTRPAAPPASVPVPVAAAHCPSCKALVCHGCGSPENKIQIYDSVLRGTSRVRYHRCRACGRNFKTVQTCTK